MVGSKARRPCERGTVAGDDHPVILAAVVLEDQEFQRRRCERVWCQTEPLSSGRELLRCGGPSQPPLCPSDRERRPGSEKSEMPTERTSNLTRSHRAQDRIRDHPMDTP